MKNFTNLIYKENSNHIIFFIILNIALVLAETFSIALIPLFIDFVVSTKPILPNYLNFFIDLSDYKNKNDLLNFGIIFFIIIFLLKNFFYLSVVFYQASLKKKFNYYLKKKFLKLYIFSPFEIMKTYNSSEILRNTDTEVQNYVTNFFNILKFSKDFFLLVSIFLLLLAVDVYSTIIALFFLLTCVFLYLLIFYNYLNKLGLRRLTTVNSIYQWINQTCGAIKEIKISRKENLVLKKFSEKVDIFEQSKKITEIISALPIALFELAFVVIVLLLIKFLANANTINSLPILSLYIVAFIRLLPIVSRFGSSMSSLRSFNPSVQLLNYEINKLEKYSKLNGKLHASGNDLVEFNKNCELRDLSFKYNDGNQYIFNQFNFSIDKGKSVAFLGKSGSGKTTLLNLICGLLKQSAGKILVDGKSINNNISEWQKNIGLISQDNYLLDDTLRNNIIFLSNPNTIDKKKLSDAIYYSGVSEFLSEIKNGLDTKIGEKGSILSGGQIQRVALARLLYRDPNILILDEFTNALDPVNEDFILDKLKELQIKRKKTFIIISHKIKPLKICDEIIILEKGKISERFNYPDFYKKYHLLYD